MFNYIVTNNELNIYTIIFIFKFIIDIIYFEADDGSKYD